jgi:glutamyl-tRNA synthetase/nondiscriminating glutamyl-tRNA synthetase
MKVRFAPSPTGQLHVGNARTALFNWLLARGNGGKYVLRIEDTDVERSTQESEASIFRDLRWLGLDWDEGPDIGGPSGPYRQSERLHLYNSYAQELLAAGQAYYCFCSPEQLDEERRAALAAGLPARYSGRCRNITLDDAHGRIAAGERAAVRFSVPPGREVAFTDAVRGEVRFQTDVIGDPVILRADGTPAYNFAVVIDDALMGMTDVLRGEDHISNTPRQLLFYEALGFAPPQFAHVAMVLGPDHTRLSKRHGATSVGEFREKGILPEALVNYLAMLGWSAGGAASGNPGNGDADTGGGHTEFQSIDVLAQRFAMKDLGHSAGVFDEEKLAWVNRHYLKTTDPLRLANLSVPFFERAGVVMSPDSSGLAFLASVVPIAAGSVDRLDQVPGRLAFLFDWAPETALADPAVREEMTSAGARAVAQALSEVLSRTPRLDRDGFRAAANEVKTISGQRAKALFHPIRVILTGRAEGPELDLAVPAIDRGAELPDGAGLPRILGCRERARACLSALGV